jgi:hypothetical protein
MQVVHGNPHHQQTERAEIPPIVPGQAKGKPAAPQVTNSPVVDPVDLSPQARKFLESGTYTAPGNSAHSTAHTARRLMAEGGSFVEISFGKVVSGLANGTLNPGDLVPGSGDPAAAVAPTVEGDGGDMPVVPTAPTEPIDFVIDEPPVGGDELVPVEEIVAADDEVVTEEEAPVAGDGLTTGLVAPIDTDTEILDMFAPADEVV